MTATHRFYMEWETPTHVAKVRGPVTIPDGVTTYEFAARLAKQHGVSIGQCRRLRLDPIEQATPRRWWQFWKAR